MTSRTHLLSTGDALLDEDGSEAKLSLPEINSLTLTHDSGPAVDAKLLASSSQAWLADDGPMGDALLLLSHIFSLFEDSGPLGDIEALLVNDFTTALSGIEEVAYVMDASTPSGPVRIPISSWQATLQVERANYVQCVVPNAGAWLAELEDMTAFTISRVVDVNGTRLEYAMATSDAENKEFYQSTNRYTCVVSGYADGFASDASPDAAYDRTLNGIRVIQTSASGTRVRAAVDFLLRPANRAWIDDSTSFVVSYINYYVTQSGRGVDEYMDAGERL